MEPFRSGLVKRQASTTLTNGLFMSALQRMRI
uniref:Uncharacterized protein n=1 Tax=Arundo donax TaxID=35708 RepID=A0A0A9EIY8_ARUDO